MKEYWLGLIKRFFGPLISGTVLERLGWLLIIILVIIGMLIAQDASAEESDELIEPVTFGGKGSPYGPPEFERQQPPILYNGPEEDAPLYTAESHPEEFCIALNVYYESRADNLAGRYAVADVVLNRTMDTRFPNTICDVVYEAVMVESWTTQKDPDLADHKRVYYPKKHRCQFSWYCDGKPDTPKKGAAWRDAQKVAWNIYQTGKFRGITEGATHYHATYVAPWWAEEYNTIGRVGAHIFYYWEPVAEQKASN